MERLFNLLYFMAPDDGGEGGEGGTEAPEGDEGATDDLMSGAEANPGTDEGGGEGEKDQGAEIEPWKMQISEDFRYHEALKGIKNPTEAVKKLIEMQEKASKTEGLAPKYRKDMSEEEFEAYKEAAGLVDAEDLGEDLQGAAEAFQKAGVTKEQWDVLQAENKKYEEELRAQQEVQAQKARNAYKQKAIEELKSEWGDEYNDNLGYMSRAVNQLFDKSFVKEIRKIGMTNSPDFAKAMAKVGKMMADDMIQQTRPSGTSTGEGFDYST